MITLKNLKSWSCRAILAATLSLGLGINTAEAQVKTLQDLKELEIKIQKVASMVEPATIALTSNKGSSGSGVIVNRTGLILTAAHVVQGNAEMSVIFSDGKVYTGKVLGANRTKDVAMVQLVKQKDWPFAELGDSKKMKIGDYVIAMGHAGGFDTKRKAPVRFGRLLSKNTKGFITTDCTLIGGDSGGPIFDINGKVIGINSSIGNNWQTNNHAGISALVSDWNRLAKGDTWGRLNQNPLADPDSPVMGFTFEEAQNNGGVILQNVVAQSPAFKAGLLTGDVLIAVDNEKIKNGKDLLIAISHHSAGDVIVAKVLRNNTEMKVKLKLARRGDFFKR